MKKSMLYFIMIVCFLLSNVTLVAAKDDLVGHNLEKEMRSVISKGIMNGYQANVYGPEDSVTREQFSAFLARALDLPPGESEFGDVSLDNLLRAEIDRAYTAGLITGYPDKTFRPTERITREQMAVMIDRALDYKGIKKTTANLTFTDRQNIHKDLVTAVSHSTYFGIINGHTNGTFKPKDHATRAHAAAFIDRFLRVVESGGKTIVQPEFQVANVDSMGQRSPRPENYTNYADAKRNVNADNQVVLQKGKVVWMKEGIVYISTRSGTVDIYENEALTNPLTYVTNGLEVDGVEMKYLDSDAQKVKVHIAGRDGFVKISEVTLLPTQQIKERSHYVRNDRGDLVHRTYNHLKNSYSSYIYGKAPSFMAANTKYYSWDGITYYTASGSLAGESYQYFNYLPLRTKSNYTAEELDSYIEYIGTVDAKYKDSPLKGLGKVFKEAEEKYQVNALYLYAKAIHESEFGVSPVAQLRKNLFGYQAYDRDPIGSAKPFETFEHSIMFVAESMNNRYLTPEADTYNDVAGNSKQCSFNGQRKTCGENYRGAVLGNKGHGMNMRYASDPFWGQKIAGHMYRADRYLKNKDWHTYKIGKTTSFLNVRHQANTNLAAQFTLPSPGYYVTILDRITQRDGEWIQIISDHKNHPHAFVHGNYVQEVTPVK